MESPQSPRWTARLKVSTDSHSDLAGDKICLPASALEPLLAQDISGPFTFRLVNPSTNRIVYAGIRDFSADDDTIILSRYLSKALDVEIGDGSSHDATIAVHSLPLPKGTFVKLRPLEAGYDEDWKPLLEQHLRSGYTTLTKGEILTVPALRRANVAPTDYAFLVDTLEPQGDAICVVDTDLEIDIEALNEEQAKETLQKLVKPAYPAGTAAGGDLTFFGDKQAEVPPGGYVDFQIPSWNRSAGLKIELDSQDDCALLDLLISPFSTRHRERPRIDNHALSNFEDSPFKIVELSSTNDILQDSEIIWVSVHSSAANTCAFKLAISVLDAAAQKTPDPLTLSEDEAQCANCLQTVPKRSLVLHESFCRRNNILCPHGCGRVFKKNSDELKDHWHCPHGDGSHGQSTGSQIQHNMLFHPETPFCCPACSTTSTFASTRQLAMHRISTCPGRLILCTFCHLEVAQGGDPDDPVPPAEVIMSGLTPHELADGARTTDCHLCGRIVRMRDLEVHMKGHDLDRKTRAPPRLCRNVNCGKTLDGVSRTGNTRVKTQRAGNDIGLCETCFGPLYASNYDPTNSMLKRRVERRYLQQLLTGCGKSHCRNEFCRLGRHHRGLGDGSAVPTKEALPTIKPVLAGLLDHGCPLHFCVDATSQNRRHLADLLKAETEQDPYGPKYELHWIAGSLEATEDDVVKAQDWLQAFAPKLNEPNV